MRIAIDATSLPPTPLGAANYIVSLTTALADLHPAERILVLVQPQHASRFSDHEQLEIVGVSRAGPLRRVIWEQTVLPLVCRRLKVDLLHSPHYSRPLLLPCRSVVTVHDLTFFLLPEVHLAYKRLFFRAMTRVAARRAQALIVPSQSTCTDLRRITRVAESRVHMVPYGIGPSFRPVRDPDRRRAIAERYGLPNEFLLYVGNLEPRKNLPRLLEAYARLPARQVVPPLVMAGTRGWKDSLLRKTMERLNLGRRVVTPGYIPQEDLPTVYSMATALVYPSLYEGFGLPVLEAMACGTPVITSNVSSMPEVAGDAALLVSPEDTETLAGALERMLGEPDLRAELSQRGLVRAREFTWRRAAESTLAVYRSVLGTA